MPYKVICNLMIYDIIFQVNNLHINVTWTRPVFPNGPIRSFLLQIQEQSLGIVEQDNATLNVSSQNTEVIISLVYIYIDIYIYIYIYVYILEQPVQCT